MSVKPQQADVAACRVKRRGGTFGIDRRLPDRSSEATGWDFLNCLPINANSRENQGESEANLKAV